MTFNKKQKVRWVMLSDVVKITTGKLNANAMVKGGKYPFFTCDAVPFEIDTYAFDTEAILISGNGSRVGHVNYCNGKFNAYQRTYILHSFKDINSGYLLTYLKAFIRNYILKNSKKGSVPYITLPMLQTFQVPILEINKQKRIVSILDKFDALVNDISIGLPAEIKARNQQYEYYRNKLLTFNEHAR